MIKIQIKEMAEKRGLNMSQVQRQTGLTAGMVRRYWNNEVDSFHMPSVEILAKYFGVPWCDLFTVTE